MSDLIFILAGVIATAGFIWVRTNRSPGPTTKPVRIYVRVDEEQLIQRIPVEIRSNSTWR